MRIGRYHIGCRSQSRRRRKESDYAERQKPKDKIGYIRRQEHEDGTTEFKFIEAKIKSVRIGKKGTKVYSDRFYALDAEELESNTEMMSGPSKLVLVGEPFITNAEMSERLKAVVDHWNKYGAETILGNRTEPPKGEEK